jgi:hypothetical protein
VFREYYGNRHSFKVPSEVLLLGVLALGALGQMHHRGLVVKKTIHARSLEGNLLGDSPD